MYYAHFILNKKGPLAKIWLAAHWDKKLTKAQIYETNIESTIETILEPQMKLALRTSGHLLLGVCRIYSRKVKYLLADCNEAFVKIKLAFRPGLIDLPKEKQSANADAITLPEKFPEFYANFSEMNMDDMEMGSLSMSMPSSGMNGKPVGTQQARIEDITLKEDFGTYVTAQDDDFGDMGTFGMDMDMNMDTFMCSDMERGRNLDNLGINITADNMSNMDDMNMDTSSMINPAAVSMNTTDKLTSNGHLIDDTLPDMNDDIGIVPALFEDQPTVGGEVQPAKKAKTNLDADKTLIENAEEEEDKENIDGEAVEKNAGKEKQIRTRRRRKLIIDEVKEIDSATMKAQLVDTTGILSILELAPPTRKIMQLKESVDVNKLFSMTSRTIHCRAVQKVI
jgi:cohesin complex subunit SCC1